MGAGLDFLINIQQKLGGGDVASKISDLEKKIKGEQQALAALERQQKQMEKLSKKEGASVDIAAYDQVRTAIAAKKQSLASLQGQLTQTAAASNQGGESFLEMAGKMKAAAGPAIAVAAAVLAVAAAIGVAIYKLAAFALAAADAHRSFLLMMQGATGSAAGAQAASAAVDRVAARSALAAAEIQQMAQTLAVAGLKGKLFEQTLQTMAAVASVAGPQAAGKIEEIAKKATALGKFKIEGDALAGLGISMADLAKQFGISVTELEGRMKAGKISVEAGMDALNKALNKRFGDAAQKQALGFSVQIMKLQENLAKLFRDVNIEPFLEALHDLLSVFDSSTSTGKALKAIVTSIFSGLFAAASAVLPYLKAFFQGFVIVVLQLYVALLPLGRAISKALGGKPNDGLLSFFTMAGKAAAYVAVGIAALAALLAAVFVPAFGIASSVVGGLVAALGLVVGAIGAAVTWIISSLSSLLSGGDAAGGSLVDGLVQGITSRIGNAIAAVQALGSAVMGGLKDLLGIHSPSAVFRSYGGFTAEGFTEGVEAGAPAAKGAVNKMVDVPKSGAAGGRRSSARAVQLAENLTLVALDPEELWAQLESKVVSLFEAAENAGPEGAPA